MPLPVNRFPNKLTLKVPNNIPRNTPFYCFASFLIVLLTLFIFKPDSSRHVTIFIISLISLFEIINVVRFAKSEGREANSKGGLVPDPNIFL